MLGISTRPYLMGMEKFITPAQLLDKDPAKLSGAIIVVQSSTSGLGLSSLLTTCYRSQSVPPTSLRSFFNLLPFNLISQSAWCLSVLLLLSLFILDRTVIHVSLTPLCVTLCICVHLCSFLGILACAYRGQRSILSVIPQVLSSLFYEVESQS